MFFAPSDSSTRFSLLCGWSGEQEWRESRRMGTKYSVFIMFDQQHAANLVVLGEQRWQAGKSAWLQGWKAQVTRDFREIFIKTLETVENFQLFRFYLLFWFEVRWLWRLMWTEGRMGIVVMSGFEIYWTRHVFWGLQCDFLCRGGSHNHNFFFVIIFLIFISIST